MSYQIGAFLIFKATYLTRSTQRCIVPYRHCRGEALAEFDEAKKLSGTNPASTGLLGYTYAVSGRRQEARKLISEWEASFARSPRDVRHPYWIATVYTALGEKDQALHWLEKSYEQHFAELVLLSVEPRFDALRPDPQFTSLLRRMNLAS